MDFRRTLKNYQSIDSCATQLSLISSSRLQMAVGVALGAVLCTALLFACSARAGNPFGHARLADFQMAADYVNLNHGSYGVVPRAVYATQRSWRDRVELNPDQFFRYDVFKAMDAQRSALAQYVGANEQDLAFVINASHGTVVLCFACALLQQ
jgi:hypothetical protein